MSLAFVWSLGFANAPLLYALAAASVPIIIHLWNRRRFREVTWAAMRFLLAAIRKNQRRIRIEQWILLAVRTLLVLLVVTAMAKPFLESFGAVIAGSRTHRVIVLDASLSMGYTVGESSRFDQAKALAAQIVKDSRRGDAISVILLSDPPRVVIGDPQPNLGEVKKEIDELAITHGGTDLAATFEKVDHVLDASPIEQKEVIYLTDLQATSWRPAAGSLDGLKRVLARFKRAGPRSVVIDLGKAGGENAAVTDLRLEAPIVTVGTPFLVRAALHNFGATAQDGVRVRLTADRRLGPEEAHDLAPGEELAVVFRQQFTSPGDHLLEVAIDTDPLVLDNRRWLVVPVRESLSVLLVDGHFKAEPYQAETDYLGQALSPGEEAAGSPRPIRVEVVPESQLSHRDLTPYDVVVLCNVAQFTPPEVADLDDYLKQGGGLVIFGGDQVLPDNYNRLLFADGKEILPAALLESRGDAAKKQAGFTFDPLNYRHAIVSEYKGETAPVTSGLTLVQTWQYHKLDIPKDSQAEVALAFDNNDPAIVEIARIGEGSSWSPPPPTRAGPPGRFTGAICRSCSRSCCASSGRLSQRNIKVGQPIDQSFPATGAAAPVTVVTPKGLPVATKLTAEGGVSQFHFEQTDLAGQYQVKIGPPLPTESSFAANTDPAESDLAKLDRAGLAQELPGWNFLYLTNSQELKTDASSVGRRGELHRPLLFGVFFLLLLESFLAWKFGHHEP